MNDLLWVVLSLSLSGSVVALALCLLKPLFRRFGKAWQYYAWLLVVLRLLLPLSPDVSMVGGLFRQVETHLERWSAPVSDALTPNDPGLPFKPAAPGPGAEAERDSEARAGLIYLTRRHLWGTLWLLVAALLLIRKAAGYWRLRKAVIRESKTVRDGPLPTVLSSVCAEMGMRRSAAVCTNALVRVPMLLGVIKPVVVLPEGEIPLSELRFIYRHELMHKRRGDYFYKWLVELAVCLHWFNPLVYWVRKQANRDCEFSCDEAVVSRLGDDERQAYGDTLLNTIARNRMGTGSAASLALCEDGTMLKERLYGIMKYRQTSKAVSLLAAAVASVLLCGTVLVGAYTNTVVETAKTGANPGPIRVDGTDLAPGGKISLGAQPLAAGTECRASLSWDGGGSLTVMCTEAGGSEQRYSIENGTAANFSVDADGEYTVAIRNDGAGKVRRVSGTVEFSPAAGGKQPRKSGRSAPSDASAGQSIVYDAVELRHYEGEGAHPYIHDIMTNNTAKDIVGYQEGMLAFDRDGNPLRVDWFLLDSDYEPDYHYLYTLDPGFWTVAAGEKDDVFGGWSLSESGDDPAVDQIAYILYCVKEATFQDGTVWKNPDYEGWRDAFEGKKADVGVLKNYYPYVQKVAF